MKLSIITINYNNKEGLRKTIESVISQTYQDFEYIVIDGNSTDGSVDIIKQYDQTTLSSGEGMGERFCWISEPDNGIYDAMNKGIRLAQGDYCLLLNSGDYLCKNDVIAQIIAQKPDADIIIGNELRGEGKTKVKLPVTFFDLYCSSLPHQSTLIKKELFGKIGLYDEDLRIVSDWEFWIRAIILNNCSVQKIEIDITRYDITGMSNMQIALRNTEREIVLNKYFPKKILDDYCFLARNRQLINYSRQLILFPFLNRVLIITSKCLYGLTKLFFKKT